MGCPTPQWSISLSTKVVHWPSSHSSASSGGRERFAGAVQSPSFNSASAQTIPWICCSSPACNTHYLLPSKWWLGCHRNWLQEKNSKAGVLLKRYFCFIPRSTLRGLSCSNLTSDFLEFRTLGLCKNKSQSQLQIGIQWGVYNWNMIIKILNPKKGKPLKKEESWVVSNGTQWNQKAVPYLPHFAVRITKPKSPCYWKPEVCITF